MPTAILTTAAASNPLSDAQAPAGYPAVLALLGLITRQVAVVMMLQHLLGILAAGVVFAAVRRGTGSGWLRCIRRYTAIRWEARASARRSTGLVTIRTVTGWRR